MNDETRKTERQGVESILIAAAIATCEFARTGARRVGRARRKAMHGGDDRIAFVRVGGA